MHAIDGVVQQKVGIHMQAGAGGADAQDWAEMLLRMYTRWAEKQGYTATVLSRAEGIKASLIHLELDSLTQPTHPLPPHPPAPSPIKAITFHLP